MRQSMFTTLVAADLALALMFSTIALPAPSPSADSTGWGSPALLDAVEGSIHGLTSPQIAMRPSEFAVAVWAQADTPTSSVRGSLFVEGRWTSPITVGTFGSVYTWPDVDVDATGRAIAVWAFDLTVYMSRFVPGGGWDVPIQLGRGVGPQVAMDPAGTAFVVRYVPEEGPLERGSLWADRFAPGTGWGAPALIETECGGFAHISLDDQGNAVVGWLCRGSSIPMVSRYTPDGGWENPTILEGRAAWVEVASDSKGTAFVLWGSEDEVLRVSRYVPGTGWEAPSVLVTEATAFIGPVSLSAGGYGTAIAAWSERSREEPLSNSSVHASHFEPDVGWQAPVVISEATDAKLTRLVRSVSMDPEGRGLVVWVEHDGTRMTVWANYHSRFSGWRNAVPISEPLSFAQAHGWSSDFPTEVATDREGRAIVVWGLTRDGRTDIWANRFVPTTLAHPEEGPGEVSSAINAFDTRFLVLVVTNAVLAAALVGLFVYSRALRRRARPPGETGSQRPIPDPSDRGNGLVTIGTMSHSREAASPLRTRWPPNNALLRLTAKERVLLHLLDYAKHSDAAEVPPELTSNGIAHAVGIDHRHVAQYLRPLTKTSFVREKTARVRGVLQRRRVYVLDAEGWRSATGIRERVVLFPVRLRDGSGTREATVADVLAATRGHRKILDVVREAIETGVVDLGH